MLSRAEHLQIAKLLRLVQIDGGQFFPNLTTVNWLEDGFWLWMWEVLCHCGHENALHHPKIQSRIAHFQSHSNWSTWHDWALSLLNNWDISNYHPTLYGWMYQFWRGAQKSQIDQSIVQGDSVEFKNISAKTQLFTEQYMVEWSVQNTVGAYWISIVANNQWPIEELNDTLAELKELRKTKPFNIQNAMQAQWQYYVSAPFESSVKSVTELRIIDPACGAGHFLIEVMIFLFACYERESKMRGVQWSSVDIIHGILEQNIYGLDIDESVLEIAKVALKIQGYLLSNQWVDIPMHLQVAPTLQEDELRHSIQLSAIPAKLQEDLVRDIVDLQQWGSLANWSNFWRINYPPETLSIVKELLICQNAKWIEYWSITERQYDIVLGNPPYLGIAHMMDPSFLNQHYPLGKWDLYTCFILRGLDVLKEGGLSCWLTMRGWLFTSTYEDLRQHLFTQYHLWKVADIGSGGFAFSPGGPVMTNVISVLHKSNTIQNPVTTVVLPKELHLQKGRDLMRLTQQGLLLQSQVFHASVQQYAKVDKWPFLYWWTPAWVEVYLNSQKIQDIATVCVGLQTGDNLRFVRAIHEIPLKDVSLLTTVESEILEKAHWVPYIKGAKQQKWFEPLQYVVKYQDGLQEMMAVIRNGRPAARPQNRQFYFQLGIAYSTIGNRFSARLHRYHSVFDVSGSSVFVQEGIDRYQICASMNSAISAQMASDLNPTQNFQVSDIARLPVIDIDDCAHLWTALEEVFNEHESSRETSIEFHKPGVSRWKNALEWADQYLNGNRSSIESIVAFPVSALQQFAFVFGQCLGRFQKEGGWAESLDFWDDRMGSVIFIDQKAEVADDLSVGLEDLWRVWNQEPLHPKGLRYYLCHEFFKTHLQNYDKRPIYWPLSSANKRFVVWINIHQLTVHTLPKVLQRLQHLAQSLVDDNAELLDFTQVFQQVIEEGPPSLNPHRQKQPHPYHPNIHDGVWVNSAALWPLLHGQWQDGKYHPKAMWELLCSTEVKNLDWSTLACLYFPKEVQHQAETDPSLQIAHRDWLKQQSPSSKT